MLCSPSDIKCHNVSPTRMYKNLSPPRRSSSPPPQVLPSSPPSLHEPSPPPPSNHNNPKKPALTTTTTTKSKISSTCARCLRRPAVSPALPMLVAASPSGAASSRLSSPVSRICTGASPLTAACNADNICRRSRKHLFKTQSDKNQQTPTVLHQQDLQKTIFEVLRQL